MQILNSVVLVAILTFSGAALADKTAGEYIDDSTLQAKVKARLADDDFFGGMSINTEVRKGVVQLGGFVDKQEEADRAAEVVSAIEGKAGMDNQLHVKKAKRSVGQSVDDGIMTTKVKTAIGDASFSSALKINVDTYNGTVLLTGFVDNQEDKDKAAGLAKEVDNVKDVINGIYVLN